MAFSGGVPVVVGREFPSKWGERKTTEDVFFLADQECPGLEIFPFLVCVLYKFMPEFQCSRYELLSFSFTLELSQCYTDA